jgi:hypothetical protein
LAAFRALSRTCHIESHAHPLSSALLRSLQDADPEIRLAGLGLLRRVGFTNAATICALTNALGLKDAEIESGDTSADELLVVNALGRMGPSARDALPLLTRMLESTNACLRQRSALAVWRISRATNLVVSVLSAMLDEPEDHSMRLAAAALSQLPPEIQLSPGTLGKLAAVLQRQSAARAATNCSVGSLLECWPTPAHLTDCRPKTNALARRRLRP